ncbi:MAG: hypothetical protein WCK42_02675 [Myxococcaceae bacterium]
MTKQKRKRTPAEKAAKKERQRKYMWVFMNGKQVRINRPQTIEGLDIDEFIRRNADPIWLHQNEMWEYMSATSNHRYTIVCYTAAHEDLDLKWIQH